VAHFSIALRILQRTTDNTSRFPYLTEFDGESYGLPPPRQRAASRASGCGAAIVEQRDEDARAARANGMAEGDGAAIYINPFRMS